LAETSGAAVGVEAATALADTARAAFLAALEDDLNLAGALGVLFDLTRDVNRALDAGEIAGSAIQPIQTILDEMDAILGVISADEDANEIPAEVLALVDERQAARQARDFARADAARDQLAALGWAVKDTPTGPQIHRA